MIKRYRLEWVVFISGAIVMMYELAGSRMISPYVGTSLYVWTSLIGVVLGSLSIGYHVGGRNADKRTGWEPLAAILFWSAVLLALTVLTKNSLLDCVDWCDFRPQVTALIDALLLFAPANVLLGMVLPHAVKIRTIHVENSASVAGNLFAVSTLGSIAGTFVAGYFIIPFLKTTAFVLVMAITLFLLSLMARGTNRFGGKFALMAALLILTVFSDRGIAGKRNVIELDTGYTKVRIRYGFEPTSKKKAVYLCMDPFSAQSAMFLNDDGLVFDYTKYFRLAKHFNPNIHRALMIGGCGYSYPKDFLRTYAVASMDVVEIDPGMTRIARTYFRLKDDERLTIIHEDARIYLNRTKKTYDVIYGDAFNSFLSVPYQLTTREAVGKMYNALNDGGLVIQNLVSAIDGPKGEFLRAQIVTYKEYFPQVYVFKVDSESSGESQNIILVALKDIRVPEFKSRDQELNNYLKTLWTQGIALDMTVLTDEYAPVEFYRMRSI